MWEFRGHMWNIAIQGGKEGKNNIILLELLRKKKEHSCHDFRLQWKYMLSINHCKVPGHLQKRSQTFCIYSIIHCSTEKQKCMYTTLACNCASGGAALTLFGKDSARIFSLRQRYFSSLLMFLEQPFLQGMEQFFLRWSAASVWGCRVTLASCCDENIPLGGCVLT